MATTSKYYTRSKARSTPEQQNDLGYKDVLEFLDKYDATDPELEMTPRPRNQHRFSRVAIVEESWSTVPATAFIVNLLLACYAPKLLMKMIVICPLIAVLLRILLYCINTPYTRNRESYCSNSRNRHDDFNKDDFNRTRPRDARSSVSPRNFRHGIWEPRRAWREVAPFILASVTSLVQLIRESLFFHLLFTLAVTIAQSLGEHVRKGYETQGLFERYWINLYDMKGLFGDDGTETVRQHFTFVTSWWYGWFFGLVKFSSKELPKYLLVWASSLSRHAINEIEHVFSSTYQNHNAQAGEQEL